MPSAPSARLALTSPLGSEAPNGAANIATLIAQLEAAVGMAKIAEVTSAGGAGAGLTFAAINQNFRHLRLVGVVRSNAGTADTLRMRLNGSSSAVYDSRLASIAATVANGADGAGITTSGALSGTSADLGVVADEATGGDVPGATSAFTLDLLDYTSATWKAWLYRSTRTTVGGFAVGPGTVDSSGAWRATAAVTDLALFLNSASGMDAVSRATLYGLR